MKYFALLLLLALGCAPSSPTPTATEATVARWVALYQQRTDFDGFLHLYTDSVVLEDIMLGYRLQGRAALQEFFSWPDPRFHKHGAETFVVLDRLIDGQQAMMSSRSSSACGVQ